METNKNNFKKLWLVSYLFIIYLLIGNFIMCKNLYDLFYLIIFSVINIYATLIKEDLE